jgi:hypothetical protein
VSGELVAAALVVVGCGSDASNTEQNAVVGPAIDGSSRPASIEGRREVRRICQGAKPQQHPHFFTEGGQFGMF